MNVATMIMPATAPADAGNSGSGPAAPPSVGSNASGANAEPGTGTRSSSAFGDAAKSGTVAELLTMIESLVPGGLAALGLGPAGPAGPVSSTASGPATGTSAAQDDASGVDEPVAGAMATGDLTALSAAALVAALAGVSAAGTSAVVEAAPATTSPAATTPATTADSTMVGTTAAATAVSAAAPMSAANGKSTDASTGTAATDNTSISTDTAAAADIAAATDTGVAAGSPEGTDAGAHPQNGTTQQNGTTAQNGITQQNGTTEQNGTTQDDAPNTAPDSSVTAPDSSVTVNDSLPRPAVQPDGKTQAQGEEDLQGVTSASAPPLTEQLGAQSTAVDGVPADVVQPAGGVSPGSSSQAGVHLQVTGQSQISAPAPVAAVEVTDVAIPELDPNVPRLTGAIRMMNRGGEQTTTLILTPESLGEVKVELRNHGGSMSVHLTASTAEGTEVLRGASRSLRHELESAGVGLDRVDVGTDGQNGQRADTQDPTETDRWRAGSARPDGTRNAAPVSTLPRPFARRPADGLDMDL